MGVSSVQFNMEAACCHFDLSFCIL